MITNKEKALVAMSGGVDSAVAALLLKDSFSLTGVTMRLWESGASIPDASSIEPDENATEALKIADALGFSHITVGLGKSFYDTVIKDFISEYRCGRTPNPCVTCNRCLKFGKLFDVASELGIPYLATGHYAKITKNENGEFELRRARDTSKDQSYFLWSIKKERLPFILFPLGDYTKNEIRALAEKNSFTNAHRSDSQDICFIPDGDYISFIEKYDSPIFKSGSFVDVNGNILGTHNGIERYTIGQRKGLGLSFGVPMFVGKKDAERNTVTLCSDKELYGKELFAHSVNLLSDLPADNVRLEAKIRYRHTPAAASVTLLDGGRLHVVFDEPQRAISSGQSVVLYDDDRVIGGGIIE